MRAVTGWPLPSESLPLRLRTPVPTDLHLETAVSPKFLVKMCTYSFCRASSMGFRVGICRARHTAHAGRPQCNPPCRDKQRSRTTWRSESKEGGSDPGCDSRQSSAGSDVRLLLCAWESAAIAGDFWGSVISSENQDVCLLKVMKAFRVCANNF